MRMYWSPAPCRLPELPASPGRRGTGLAILGFAWKYGGFNLQIQESVRFEPMDHQWFSGTVQYAVSKDFFEFFTLWVIKVFCTDNQLRCGSRWGCWKQNFLATGNLAGIKLQDIANGCIHGIQHPW